MAMRQITHRLPQIRDNGNGTVTLRIGKVQWDEPIDEPLIDLTDREVAIIQNTKFIVMMKHGIRTWQELLNNPIALAAYNDITNKIWVDD